MPREISQPEALDICRQYGAFYEGHYIGTQGNRKGLGLHMREYFDSRTLVTKPASIAELAPGMAYNLRQFGVEVVVSIPIGAITAGHEVAQELECDFAIAEKGPGGKLVIDRSAFVDVVKGRRTALVEDTINAGETLLSGAEAIRVIGGRLVAAAAIINRGPLTAKELGVPVLPLISRRMASLTLQQCLREGQCARREPINRRPGHGHHLEQLVQQGVVEHELTFV